MKIGININTIFESIDKPISDTQKEIIKNFQIKGHKIAIVITVLDTSVLQEEITRKQRIIVEEWLKANDINYDDLIITKENDRDICVNNGINYMVRDVLNQETFESISNVRLTVEEVMHEMFNINIYELPKKAQKGLADIEYNHDWCWVRDLYEKSIKENNLNKVAIFYRGTKITYKELFKKAGEYAYIFSKNGIKAGDEVPMCMGNCPEFLYVIMALNLLGSKMNCFGAFDQDYLTEIINDCNSQFVICTDDQYPLITKALDNSSTGKVIMFSLADSLPNGINPYAELDKNFYDFENMVKKYQETDRKIVNGVEFFKVTELENVPSIKVYDNGGLNTEFLVTYSSGSTNSSRPKAIIHTNRSLITIGRFQDPDLSGLPKMDDLIGEAMIPTHSNTGIISSMSDVLYKGCTVAQEPIYHRDFLLISLMINKPNYISATRTMILEAAKKIYYNEEYAGFKMPYMMMLTAVGEPISKGEEKFINKMLKKAKCGCDKFPAPFAPVPLSIGGGDCERGGMFFTPYRAFQDLNPKYSISSERCGLKPYSMVQLALLDQNYQKLPNDSTGLLVAKTPTTMKKYKNNPEATNDFYITTSTGEKWSNCFAYGFIEKYGTVEILERIGKELILENGLKFPLFYIGKEIEKDTKNILSYEVVNISNELVAHIELQPGTSKSFDEIINSINCKITEKYGEKIATKIFYRERTHAEGFPGTKCEKRSYLALLEEGITDLCIKPKALKESNSKGNNRVLKKVYFK